MKFFSYNKHHRNQYTYSIKKWNFRSAITKLLDSDLKVNKFELQLGYDVHSRTNNIGKVMNLLIPPPRSVG